MKNEIINELLEDMKAYFKARSHRFVVLSGDMGPQKNTIAKTIAKELRSSSGFTIAPIDQDAAKINDNVILNKLMRITGCPKQSCENQEKMPRRIKEQKVLLVINDAHKLRDDTLFGLKNIYEIGVSILLVAGPELAEKLQSAMYEEIWCAEVFQIQNYGDRKA